MDREKAELFRAIHAAVRSQATVGGQVDQTLVKQIMTEKRPELNDLGISEFLEGKKASMDAVTKVRDILNP